MIDFQSLNNSLKSLVEETVASGAPTALRYGTVVSGEPNLKIRLTTDAAVELGSEFLTVPKTYSQASLEGVKISGTLGGEEVSGTVTLEYDNRLKAGDKVLLIQQKGGQRFAVIGRC